MAENDENNEGLFDLSKKKKKKKPRDDQAGNTKEDDENTPIDSQSKENKSKTVAFADENREESATQQQATGAGDDDNDESDVLKGKKKKKSKARIETTVETGEAENQDEAVTRAVTDETTTDSSQQSEHTYYEMLSRVFSIIQEKNPSAGDDRDRIKLTIKPPQVARVGTKRTSFSNFGEICKSLKRPEKHLQQYVLAELGTNGSIDANTAMIIKGRFQQKQMESVLRTYIKEYVICKTCRSADTVLQKEERLTVLLCNTCRSRYFVTGIKTGFQAQVGKRAATRAKAT